MSRRTTWVVVATVVAAVALAAVAQETSERRRNRDGGREGRREGREERTGNVERVDVRDAPPPQTSPATQYTQPGQAPRGAPMPEKYAVLLQRSIFARGGAAARTGGPSTTQAVSTAPVLSPQQQVVLLGVLCPDEQFVAFAENRVTRQVLILHPGDEVAGGRVAAITLDSVAFVQGSKELVIRVGQNLAGETVAPGVGAFAGTTSSGTTSSSTPPASPEQAAILERLRQQRRQQVGQ